MIRGALVVALSFLAACGGGVERRLLHIEDKISHVSQTWSATPRFDRGPTRYVLTLEFTMPKQFPVGVLGDITMTDTSGRRFESTENSLSIDSDGVQRIGTKFEVAEGSQVGVVHIGDDYDVDVSSGRITRRAAASAAP
jgi:hypothetical protein